MRYLGGLTNLTARQGQRADDRQTGVPLGNKCFSLSFHGVDTMRSQPRSALRPSLAFLGLVALASGLAALPASGAGDKQPKSEKLWVFVGTYTSAKGSKGIYRFEMD